MAKQSVKNKLPKQIAGVKVPKELRKAGASAVRLMEHPVVSDLVVAALLAAAVALKDNKSVRDAAGAVGDEAGEAAAGTARVAGKAKVALKAAAGAIGQGILEEFSGGGKSGAKAGKSRGKGGRGKA